MSEQAAEVLYFQFFAWSAIPWVPEVLLARYAFVTSFSQAGKADRISETLCENTFSFVLILFYLTGILFVSVKAVQNILQSIFAAIAQNTLRAPRGKSSSDRRKNKQTKKEIH